MLSRFFLPYASAAGVLLAVAVSLRWYTQERDAAKLDLSSQTSLLTSSAADLLILSAGALLGFLFGRQAQQPATAQEAVLATELLRPKRHKTSSSRYPLQRLPPIQSDDATASTASDPNEETTRSSQLDIHVNVADTLVTPSSSWSRSGLLEGLLHQGQQVQSPPRAARGTASSTIPTDDQVGTSSQNVLSSVLGPVSSGLLQPQNAAAFHREPTSTRPYLQHSRHLSDGAAEDAVSVPAQARQPVSRHASAGRLDGNARDRQSSLTNTTSSGVTIIQSSDSFLVRPAWLYSLHTTGDLEDNSSIPTTTLASQDRAGAAQVSGDDGSICSRSSAQAQQVQLRDANGRLCPAREKEIPPDYSLSLQQPQDLDLSFKLGVLNRHSSISQKFSASEPPIQPAAVPKQCLPATGAVPGTLQSTSVQLQRQSSSFSDASAGVDGGDGHMPMMFRHQVDLQHPQDNQSSGTVNNALLASLDVFVNGNLPRQRSSGPHSSDFAALYLLARGSSNSSMAWPKEGAASSTATSAATIPSSPHAKLPMFTQRPSGMQQFGPAASGPPAYAHGLHGRTSFSYLRNSDGSMADVIHAEGRMFGLPPYSLRQAPKTDAAAATTTVPASLLPEANLHPVSNISIQTLASAAATVAGATENPLCDIAPDSTLRDARQGISNQLHRVPQNTEITSQVSGAHMSASLPQVKDSAQPQPQLSVSRQETTAPMPQSLQLAETQHTSPEDNPSHGGGLIMQGQTQGVVTIMVAGDSSLDSRKDHIEPTAVLAVQDVAATVQAVKRTSTQDSLAVSLGGDENCHVYYASAVSATKDNTHCYETRRNKSFKSSIYRLFKPVLKKAGKAQANSQVQACETDSTHASHGNGSMQPGCENTQAADLTRATHGQKAGQRSLGWFGGRKSRPCI